MTSSIIFPSSLCFSAFTRKLPMQKKHSFISTSLGFCYLLSMALYLFIYRHFVFISLGIGKFSFFSLVENKNIKQKETKRDYFVGPEENFSFFSFPSAHFCLFRSKNENYMRENFAFEKAKKKIYWCVFRFALKL